MTVLIWVAVLVGGWCAASVITALILGTFLRHRREATDPRQALRPLAVGPLDLWAVVGAEVPDTPASLTTDPDAVLPAPRTASDGRTRDPEGVG